MTAYCLERSHGLPPRCSSSLPDLRVLEVIGCEGNNQQIDDCARDLIHAKAELISSDFQFETHEKANNYEQQLSTYNALQTLESDEAVHKLSGFFLGEDYTSSPKSVTHIDSRKSASGYMLDGMQNHKPTKLIRRKSCLKKTRINSQQKYNKVSFASKSSVRYYAICLGDNPSCSYGIPISLGWEYEEGKVELKRHLLRSPVQRLSYHDRRNLLQSAGYGYNEMRSTILEIKRVQRSRLMTEFLMPLDNMVDAVFGGVQKILSPDS